MEDNNSVGTKEYRYSVQTILNAINDLVELQKGEVTFDDISRKRIFFRVEMYGFSWEYHFTVEDIGENSSRVLLEIKGEVTNRSRRIVHQLALLDSVLISNGGEAKIAST